MPLVAAAQDQPACDTGQGGVGGAREDLLQRAVQPRVGLRLQRRRQHHARLHRLREPQPHPARGAVHAALGGGAVAAGPRRGEHGRRRGLHAVALQELDEGAGLEVQLQGVVQIGEGFLGGRRRGLREERAQGLLEGGRGAGGVHRRLRRHAARNSGSRGRARKVSPTLNAAPISSGCSPAPITAATRPSSVSDSKPAQRRIMAVWKAG